MMTQFTKSELDSEMVTMLPAKETLFFNHWNFGTQVSQSATSVNLGGLGAFQMSSASNNISVTTFNTYVYNDYGWW